MILESQFRMRPMTHDDLQMVLAWRNHPDIRKNMFSQHEISLEEHENWFLRSSKDDRMHLLIFEQGGQAQGFVSFKAIEENKIAEWGFYLTPGAPKGSGLNLGKTALSYAFNDINYHKILSHVLPDNIRSLNFHHRLGFTEKETLKKYIAYGKVYNGVIIFELNLEEWFSIERMRNDR
jgi:UDP-4-amino-4,6-dideoxy-N-acetyl-beta-L-altrosamine N-acetyltransferase